MCAPAHLGEIRKPQRQPHQSWCACCGFEGLRLTCSEYGAAALLLRLLGLESSLAALRPQVLFLHPLSASSWAGGLEESGVERGVPGIEQGRVGHFQLARFICKPLQLQAICNCNPVGMLVVIPFCACAPAQAAGLG